MRSGKKKRPPFKKNTVWFDPWTEKQYVIIRVYKENIYLRFLDYGTVIKVTTAECEEDEFVRVLTSLEKELM